MKSDFISDDDSYSDFVKVNDELIFKFSKYDWTVAYLENEADAISYIRKYVRIRLPDVQKLRKGALKYGAIKGMPMTRQRFYMLKKSEREDIFKQLAHFLNDIHSASLKNKDSIPVYDSPVMRTRDEWLEEYERIKFKVFPYCHACMKDSVELIFQHVKDDEDFLKFKPAFVHASLTPKNILVSEESKRINGITGFELSGIGDPAYDLSVLLNEYGEAFVRKIGKYYKINNTNIDRARFYAFANRLEWCLKVADMLTTHDFSRFYFLL